MLMGRSMILRCHEPLEEIGVKWTLQRDRQPFEKQCSVADMLKGWIWKVAAPIA